MMNLSIKLISFLFFILFLGCFSPRIAFADTVQLSGNISDNIGGIISGASVTIFNSNTQTSAGSTISDSSGNYTLTIPNGTYDVQVSPPSGSNFSPAIALSQTITNNTTLNFVLVPAGTVTLSGHLYNTFDTPLPNQIVSLQLNGSTIASATTDGSGSYSLEVSPNTYKLDITGNGDSSFSMPPLYDVYVQNYQLTQSTILDITIPTKKIDVHVQDGLNNPLSNIEIEARQDGTANNGHLAIGGNITNAYGEANISGLTTDQEGNALLWLIPNDSNHSYNITALAPPESNFSNTTSRVVVTEDTNLTVILQQPVTLSGRVLDPFGNPVANQKVYLQTSNSVVATTFSDTLGNYSLQVTPDTYKLFISGLNNDQSLNIPQSYEISIPNYSLTENTTFDIMIPAKKVDIHIQDVTGNSLSDVDVRVKTSGNANTDHLTIGEYIVNATGTSSYSSGQITDSSGNIAVWLIPNDNFNKYIFTALPPAESGLLNTSITVTVPDDTTITITLQQPVSLNGHVYNSLGDPLPNQTVSLQLEGSDPITTTTDNSGSYYLQASPNAYKLDIMGQGSQELNLPDFYDVYSFNYQLNENTLLDITVPLKKINVHVQDQQGNAMNNIQIKATQNGIANNGHLSIGGGITNAYGESGYSPGLQTDESGNVMLWLIPNDSGRTYTLTARPSRGSIYSQFSVNNFSVNQDQTEIISLQYNHATPITTADLATQRPDETYSNPTTVSLSATADEGYAVENTYYTIDGGPQQTYTAPFTISGESEHTIEYWSVDNSGVQEAHNTKAFIIYVNQSPILDPIGNKTVAEGQTLQFTISAIDPDGDNLLYSAANLPPGATFNPFTRIFSWTPDFTQEGNYFDIEFTVTDDGNPMGLDVESIIITVGGVNRVPIFDTIGSQTVLEDQLLSFTVNATDPDGDSVTLSAENLPQGSSFNAQTGALSWTPMLNQAGNYIITFNATDNATPSETGILDVAITVGDNPTPTEQAENIITTLIGYNLPTNIENAYLANLKKLPTFIEKGKIKPAGNQLTAFIEKVEEDYTNGNISQEIHDTLISLAQQLLSDLQ